MAPAIQPPAAPAGPRPARPSPPSRAICETMRTTVSILTLGLILAGCMWTPWKKPDDRPILPHGQFVGED